MIQIKSGKKKIRLENEKLNKEDLEELKNICKMDKRYREFCLTGLELTMDQFMETYNDTSKELNYPIK